MRVDLHTHTTASDGQYTPTELIANATKCGIVAIAITDHDTIDGLEEGIEAGEQYNITVINGVELGAMEDRHLHILGYGFDRHNSGLATLCNKLKGGRDERKYRIITFLKEKGIDISLEEVEALAGGDIIARPHFAQIMVKHGFVANAREAFDRYLDTNEYQRIERFKATAQVCIQTIKQAGGYAVLAHPYQLKYPREKLEELLVELKSHGLDGLECYCPVHTSTEVEMYLNMAQRYGLNVTAGSDFHGEAVKPDIALTPIELDIDWMNFRQ